MAQIDDFQIRRLDPADSLEEITELLHRAYAPLGAMGLQFVAVAQSVEMTRKRCAAGETWVATRDGKIVATVTFYPAGREAGHRYYARPDVSCFGQFAVEPSLQGAGLGRRLVELCAERARESGAAYLACDTAQGATHLVELYQRWGFEIVDTADWELTNFESYVLSRPV